MTPWLGVVSAEHVRRGVTLGIAQVGHGKRTGLARMRSGDWLVYYSPRNQIGDASQLRAFTAIGEIADDEIWQADEGDFKPFRRRVNYCQETKETPIASLIGALLLTQTPNWGYQLKRGLISLTDQDFNLIRAAMLGGK